MPKTLKVLYSTLAVVVIVNAFAIVLPVVGYAQSVEKQVPDYKLSVSEKSSLQALIKEIGVLDKAQAKTSTTMESKYKELGKKLTNKKIDNLIKKYVKIKDGIPTIEDKGFLRLSKEEQQAIILGIAYSGSEKVEVIKNQVDTSSILGKNSMKTMSYSSFNDIYCYSISATKYFGQSAFGIYGGKLVHQYRWCFDNARKEHIITPLVDVYKSVGWPIVSWNNDIRGMQCTGSGLVKECTAIHSIYLGISLFGLPAGYNFNFQFGNALVASAPLRYWQIYRWY